MKRLATLLFAFGSIAGCNAILGLEEHDVRAPVDAAPAVDSGADGDTRDRGFEPCSSDADCITPNACYTPRCNTELGVCTYRLCSTDEKPCSIGKCDTSTFHCSAPVPYSTRTTTYPVESVTIACKTNDTCIGAAFPFVVIGAASGPVALLVDDLAASAAVKVPIDGVPFKATQVIASGRRIWLLGDAVGAAVPFEQPIAFIDVPSDPTVKSLLATAATILVPYAATKGFASTSGSLLLVRDDPTEGFPAVRITPPITERASAVVVNVPNQPAPSPTPPLPMYRLATAPAGSNVVAISGARLVLYRAGAVNFVNDAATPAVALGADFVLGATLLPPHFSSGLEGEVAATFPLVADLPAPDCNCSSHMRVQWFVQSATATMFDTAAIGDVEGYVNPPKDVTLPSCRMCPLGYFNTPSAIGIVDTRTVLETSSAAENRALSAAHVVTRDPVANIVTRRTLRQPTEVPSGNLATDRVGIVTSTGFAYELFANSESNAVNLSIYDPRCDVK